MRKMRFRNLILRVLPREFRHRHGRDLLELYVDAYCEEGEGRRPGFWIRAVWDALTTAFAVRLEDAWRRLRGKEKRQPLRIPSSVPPGSSTGSAFSPNGLWADLRHAVRALRRRPLFAALAILTLGLGIGATTAVFSVVDSVLLRALPYGDPDRLLNVWQVDHGRGEVGDPRSYWDRGAISYPQYRAWRAATSLFEDVAVHRSWEVTMTGGGRPELMTIGIVSSSLFPVLGAQPSLGRWFHPGEEATTPGDGAPVAILSCELWRASFLADPEVLGKTIRLNDRTYQIVGVMPEEFKLRRLGGGSSNGVDADLSQVWVPIGVPGVDLGPGAGHWEAIGRLRPGVSLDDALLEARRILLAGSEDAQRDVRVVPRKEAENRGFASPILMLLGASGLLMLIACVNTATLMLGEMHGRRFDLATRFALGADGRRIVRQLLTESILLGVSGSLIGVLIGSVGARLLTALAPPLPGLDQVGADLRVLAVAASLGVLCGIIFGTIPALISARNTVSTVSRGLHRTTVGSGSSRFESGLVSLQIALTTVLLVGSGLFAQSLTNLISVYPGFEAGDLITVPATLSQGRYPTDEARSVFYREALQRIRAVPGVSAATATDNFLFPANRMNMDGVLIPAVGAGEDLRTSLARFSVAPGYFDVMNIPVLAGRGLGEMDDGDDAQPVVVVSQEAADRFWPGESPVGARLRHWTGEAVVVGVVSDVKFQRMDADVSPILFVPLGKTGSRGYQFLVSIEGNTTGVVPGIREAIWSIDSDVPIGEATTVASLLARAGTQERFRTWILSAFGVAATLLAVTGVFSVTARSVASRLPELGIRMALGADERVLVMAASRNGLLMGILGTTVGIVGAFFATMLLSGFLFGVKPTDSPTYAAVVVLLLFVSLLASYFPARRITTLDPAEVLRAEGR